MANRARLRITGIDELRHAMQAYGQQLVAAAVDAVTEAVQDTVTDARAAAPVLTGRLRDSITGALKTDGYSMRGTVRATAPHAHLIEFGTERIDAHPFLVPAAVRQRRELTTTLQAAVVRLSPEGLGTPRVTGTGASTPGMSVAD